MLVVAVLLICCGTQNALLDMGSYRMPSLIPLAVYTGIVPAAGLLIGFVYTGTAVKLANRGLGELAVALKMDPVELRVINHADNHPIEVCSDLIDGVAAGRGTLAILPSDIELTGASPHDCATGVVTSSLFGRERSDVVVESHGVSFRCSVYGRRPAVGDAVTMTARRGIFDPAR